MIFDLTKTSNYAWHEFVEIDTLEELKAIYNKYCGEPNAVISCWYNKMIVDFKQQWIEIYDDWRE